MAYKSPDAVCETFITTGTGAITPTGVVAGKGFQSIASALSSGDTAYFTAEKNGQRQSFIGTWNGTTVARTTTKYSTAGGTSDASFGAGTGTIFIDPFGDALKTLERLAWAAAAITPPTNDGTALGTTALQFSDLFLAEGGVINWDNGDVSITQTGNVLSFAGATTRYEFDANVTPSTSDGAALGTTGLMWSDAFFASGAVLNFNNGNYTVTHSAGVLTFAGDIAYSGALTGASITITGQLASSGAGAAGVINRTGGGNATLSMRTGGTQQWQFQVDSAGVGYITNSGTTAGVQLASQAATSWSAFSDERVKDNIEELSVLNTLDGFRAVRFLNKLSGAIEIGVIAQKEFKRRPEFIKRGDDSEDDGSPIIEFMDKRTWSAIYDRYGVEALMGVKELLALVLKLQARLDAIDGKAVALKK